MDLRVNILLILLGRKHSPKVNSIVLFLESFRHLNCLLDVMEPVYLILCQWLGVAHLWSKAVFFEVIALDPEAVVIQTPFPFDGSRVKVELSLLCH